MAFIGVACTYSFAPPMLNAPITSPPKKGVRAVHSEVT